MAIQLQMSDVSQYTLYNHVSTSLECVDIDIAVLLGNGTLWLGNNSAHNQCTNGTASFPGRVGLTYRAT